MPVIIVMVLCMGRACMMLPEHGGGVTDKPWVFHDMGACEAAIEALRRSSWANDPDHQGITMKCVGRDALDWLRQLGQ